MDFYLLQKKKKRKKEEKKEERGEKDVANKLMSKSDVMSLSGVMYPYVSKKDFNKTYKTFSN